MMIKLCAFADEAESSLAGQIAALKRNNIPYLELRSIAGKNVRDFFHLSPQRDKITSLAISGCFAPLYITAIAGESSIE